MVDQQIVEIVRERLGACRQREGPNERQNCAKEMEQLVQVTKAYQDKCEYGHSPRGQGVSHHVPPTAAFFSLQDVTDICVFSDGDLGVHGNARTCLMKQKHKMMEERKKQAEASQ